MAIRRLPNSIGLQNALNGLAKKYGSGGTVRAGFLEGAEPEADGTPVAAVAFFNEFGTQTTPPRPFFRNAIAEDQTKWAKLLGKELERTGGNVQAALGTTGEAMRRSIQMSITRLTDPPLKPETIERKGFAKPLVDTNHMSNSVKYEVSDRKGK